MPLQQGDRVVVQNVDPSNSAPTDTWTGTVMAVGQDGVKGGAYCVYVQPDQDVPGARRYVAMVKARFVTPA